LEGPPDQKMELRKIARTIHDTWITLQRLVFAAGWEMVIGSTAVLERSLLCMHRFIAGRKTRQ